jgi:hypothetical protein
LAELMLKGEIKPGVTLSAKKGNEKIDFEVQPVARHPAARADAAQLEVGRGAFVAERSIPPP